MKLQNPYCLWTKHWFQSKWETLAPFSKYTAQKSSTVPLDQRLWPNRKKKIWRVILAAKKSYCLIVVCDINCLLIWSFSESAMQVQTIQGSCLLLLFHLAPNCAKFTCTIKPLGIGSYEDVGSSKDAVIALCWGLTGTRFHYIRTV